MEGHGGEGRVKTILCRCKGWEEDQEVSEKRGEAIVRDQHSWGCCKSISETKGEEREGREERREEEERRGERRGREHTFAKTSGDLSFWQAAWRVVMICSSVFPFRMSRSIWLARARHSWHDWGVCSRDGRRMAWVGGAESVAVTTVGGWRRQNPNVK